MNRTALRRILAQEGIFASEQEADKLEAEAEASEDQANADRSKADAARMASSKRARLNWRDVADMTPEDAMEAVDDLTHRAGRKAKSFRDITLGEIAEKEDYVKRLDRAWDNWDWKVLADLNIVSEDEADFAREVLASYS